MAGMSGRFSTVIKAKINKLLDRAEDPGETLDYSYQKQMEMLQNVKKGIADVVTAKKRLQLQSRSSSSRWSSSTRRRARRSAQGREDLARMALERKQFAQTELQSLDQQVAELEDQQQSSPSPSSGCAPSSSQFRTKKEVIKAQYSAAEAQVKISEAATGVGEEMADVGPRDAARHGQDREHARPRGRDRGARGGRHVRRQPAARLWRGRHRPPAARADPVGSGSRTSWRSMKAELGQGAPCSRRSGPARRGRERPPGERPA